MNIRKMIVPESKYAIKCPHRLVPEFIVVHNTANDASANNEIKYMSTNTRQVSFHYAVDDKEIVQGIEENRNSWNAGDGGSGKGNRKGISIEICYSKSGGQRFVDAERNAVKLIADILKRYNWGVDKVTKHQDYSGKYCPHRTLDMGWNRFIQMVRDELNQPIAIIPKPIYTGTSIVTYLNSIGVDSSKTNRKKLASQYGIKGYNFLGWQNTRLLKEIRGF